MHDHICPAFLCNCPSLNRYASWGEREFVSLRVVDMSILCNVACQDTQRLTCGCPPGSFWVQTEGIEKLFNSNRGHEATSVKLNPITFPCIKTPEGIILCPNRPENVARQISAIHGIGKDISHLVGSLIMLTWDGKCIPALSSTLFHLHSQQLLANPGRKPPTTIMRCSLRTLGV